jgi:hypothetical protein
LLWPGFFSALWWKKNVRFKKLGLFALIFGGKPDSIMDAKSKADFEVDL